MTNLHAGWVATMDLKLTTLPVSVGNVKIGELYQEPEPLGDQQQRGQLEATGRLPQGVTGEGPVPHPVRGHPPNTPRMVQRRWGSQCVCGSVQAGCMHNTQPYLFQNSEPTNTTHNNGQL